MSIFIRVPVDGTENRSTIKPTNKAEANDVVIEYTRKDDGTAELFVPYGDTFDSKSVQGKTVKKIVSRYCEDRKVMPGPANVLVVTKVRILRGGVKIYFPETSISDKQKERIEKTLDSILPTGTKQPVAGTIEIAYDGSIANSSLQTGSSSQTKQTSGSTGQAKQAQPQQPQGQQQSSGGQQQPQQTGSTGQAKQAQPQQQPQQTGSTGQAKQAQPQQPQGQQQPSGGQQQPQQTGSTGQAKQAQPQQQPQQPQGQQAQPQQQPQQPQRQQAGGQQPKLRRWQEPIDAQKYADFFAQKERERQAKKQVAAGGQP